MAVCEQGYLCEVCGLEVAEIDESDLYLRYVLGEVDPETLHVQPERHLRCNPTLAQFIVADGFAPVVVEGFFAKSELDPEFVAAEEARVTRGYLRLLELPGLGLPLTEYPAARGPGPLAGPDAGRAGAGDGPATPRRRDEPHVHRRPTRRPARRRPAPTAPDPLPRRRPRAGRGLPGREPRRRLGPDRRRVHRAAGRRAGTRSTSTTTSAASSSSTSSRDDCGMEVVRWLCLRAPPAPPADAVLRPQPQPRGRLA